MSQIGIAMHNYESEHGALPPAAVTDKDGKPLLSWRVAILPFIEGDRLYQQFHLDEPWDSPHNITLLDKMPPTFKTLARRMNPPPNPTDIQLFAGKNTLFEPGKKFKLEDFARGSSNTLLLIECGEPVPWTKPADIDIDPDGSFPQPKSVVPDIMRYITADCSTHFFPLPLDESELRKLIWIR